MPIQGKTKSARSQSTSGPTAVTAVLGPASATYNDYLGTAAADELMALLHQRSLYQIVGIEREDWLITGFELALGRVDCITIYATRRVAPEEATTESSAMPVVAFEVMCDPTTLHAILREAFCEVRVQLISRASMPEQFLVIERRPVALDDSSTSIRA